MIRIKEIATDKIQYLCFDMFDGRFVHDNLAGLVSRELGAQRDGNLTIGT